MHAFTHAIVPESHCQLAKDVQKLLRLDMIFIDLSNDEYSTGFFFCVLTMEMGTHKEICGMGYFSGRIHYYQCSSQSHQNITNPSTMICSIHRGAIFIIKFILLSDSQRLWAIADMIRHHHRSICVNPLSQTHIQSLKLGNGEKPFSQALFNLSKADVLYSTCK